MSKPRKMKKCRGSGIYGSPKCDRLVPREVWDRREGRCKSCNRACLKRGQRISHFVRRFKKFLAAKGYLSGFTKLTMTLHEAYALSGDQYIEREFFSSDGRKLVTGYFRLNKYSMIMDSRGAYYDEFLTALDPIAKKEQGLIEYKARGDARRFREAQLAGFGVAAKIRKFDREYARERARREKADLKSSRKKSQEIHRRIRSSSGAARFFQMSHALHQLSLIQTTEQP